MTNQELFKQAIADAKSVRDAAVANAKAALEETFTPKIMSMLSAKLNELEEEDMEEGKKVEEEGYGKEEGIENAMGYEAGQQKPEESYGLEETDLDEILAQLEAEEKGKQEEGKEEVEEAKHEVEEAKKDEVEEAKKDDDKKKVEESLEEADDDSEEAEEMDDEADGDEEMTELTVDELKDIIRDVLKDVLASDETAGEESGEELDLTTMGDEAGDDETEDEDDSISLEELLAELDKEDDAKKVKEAKDEMEEGKKEVEEAKKEEMEETKKDLEEAIKTIKSLQVELNEVNLLNAKLLYTNKIFKSKSLNEAQKVKVLKSLDKAVNVKEAKAIFETLSEALSGKTTKSSIKESVGFASKAMGVAPKQPIVESDAAIRRMQQLAGIIK
jgi:hypothetical protein